jgi:hypothetical protein
VTCFEGEKPGSGKRNALPRRPSHLVTKLNSKQAVVDAVLRGVNKTRLPASGFYDKVVTVASSGVTGVVRFGTLSMPWD